MIDHSILSPDGHASKAANAAAKERNRKALFGDGLAWPTCPQETKAEGLRRRAKELYSLAASGMHPRSYFLRARELEAQARQAEGI